MSSIAAALAALTVAACGGGGSADGGASNPALPITASNQVAVVRATLDSGFVLRQSTVLGTDRRAAQQWSAAAPAPAGIDVLRLAVRNAVQHASAPRGGAEIEGVRRPAAIVNTEIECVQSGRVTIALDDRDGNGFATAGDVDTVTYDHCNMGSVVMHGTVVLSFGESTQDPFSSLMSVAFRNYSATVGTDVTTLDGKMSDAWNSSEDGWLNALTVQGEGLTATFSGTTTPGTWVYEPGMEVRFSNSFSGGATSVAMNGSFRASTLGGQITVATLLPVVQPWTENYPTSGLLKVTGRTGSALRITVLDATSMRLEVDPQGDGTFEAPTLLPWIDTAVVQ